jgi:hypothetical protein
MMTTGEEAGADTAGRKGRSIAMDEIDHKLAARFCRMPPHANIWHTRPLDEVGKRRSDESWRAITCG